MLVEINGYRIIRSFSEKLIDIRKSDNVYINTTAISSIENYKINYDESNPIYIIKMLTGAEYHTDKNSVAKMLKA